jgi:hypothetical protein
MNIISQLARARFEGPVPKNPAAAVVKFADACPMAIQ